MNEINKIRLKITASSGESFKKFSGMNYFCELADSNYAKRKSSKTSLQVYEQPNSVSCLHKGKREKRLRNTWGKRLNFNPQPKEGVLHGNLAFILASMFIKLSVEIVAFWWRYSVHESLEKPERWCLLQLVFLSLWSFGIVGQKAVMLSEWGFSITKL